MFWLTGLFYEAVYYIDPPLVLVGLLVTLGGGLITLVLAKRIPAFLQTSAKFWTAFGIYSIWIVATYIASTPVAAGIWYLYVWVLGRQLPIVEGEFVVGLIIAILWLPLWWSVGAGLAIAWFRHRNEWRQPLASSYNKSLNTDTGDAGAG